MTSVSEAWARVESWICQHAPASGTVLAPPATPDAITAAEAVLGMSFPAELVESLGCHDGFTRWANILPEAALLSVAGIVEFRQMRMEIAASDDGFTPHGGDVEPWWHELWLPYATAESDIQFIDVRPGPGYARLGWACITEAGDFSGSWPSVGAYLAAVAEALESGGPVRDWHPYLTAAGELWWSLAVETELNGEPLRPAPAS